MNSEKYSSRRVYWRTQMMRAGIIWKTSCALESIAILDTEKKNHQVSRTECLWLGGQSRGYGRRRAYWRGMYWKWIRRTCYGRKEEYEQSKLQIWVWGSVVEILRKHILRNGVQTSLASWGNSRETRPKRIEELHLMLRTVKKSSDVHMCLQCSKVWKIVTVTGTI